MKRLISLAVAASLASVSLYASAQTNNSSIRK